MSMKVNIRQQGSVSIVDLAGRVTLGEGSGTLRDTVKDLIGAGNRNLLLNLRDVTYIDSAGLGEMVGAYASVRNAGGQIKIENVPDKVHSLLQVTKLYVVFQAFSDEDAALKSFSGEAASA